MYGALDFSFSYREMPCWIASLVYLGLERGVGTCACGLELPVEYAKILSVKAVYSLETLELIAGVSQEKHLELVPGVGTCRICLVPSVTLYATLRVVWILVKSSLYLSSTLI